MRAVRGSSAGVLVVDTPDPIADSNQVIVGVSRAGICASDLHMIAEGFTGVTLGHEFGGRLHDGTLVAVRPTGACGSCDSCMGGRINLCASAFGGFHGGLIDGGWADRVCVDRSTMFAVPQSVTPGGAALVEPLAVAVHGMRRVVISEGDRVAVIGGGSVGLAVVAALNHLGIEVDIDARYPHQQQAAEQLGAHVGLRGNYGIVLDAVGSQSAVEASVRACRSGGSIVELGVFWQPITLGRELTLREISLIPALFYAHDHSQSDFDLAIEIIATKPDIESIFVTHVFGLEDAAEAVRVAGDRSAGAIKVHLAIGE
ncbi:MAG: hypothetical protein RLZ37_224 [Actinomycetota bacterium]